MRLFFAIIIALSSAFTFTGGAEFSFQSKNHDFTDTNEGVVLEHDYHFTNTGTAPLIISDYKVACTCTKITYPKNPIAPNQSASIHLSFDTQGKYGYQNRKIELISNAKRSVFLSFRVFVVRETTP
jgi:hypothetical protein